MGRDPTRSSNQNHLESESQADQVPVGIRVEAFFLTRSLSMPFLTFRTRRFLTTWSRTRAWTGSNKARLTKSALLAPTRAVFLQFARPAVSSGLAGTQLRPNGTRQSGGCPKARRERQCSLRSKCRSLGRHCCVCASKNVCYASWLQAYSRPQSNDRSTIDAVAGDLRTNGHLLLSIFCGVHGRLVSDNEFALFKQASKGYVVRVLLLSATAGQAH